MIQTASFRIRPSGPFFFFEVSLFLLFIEPAVDHLAEG